MSVLRSNEEAKGVLRAILQERAKDFDADHNRIAHIFDRDKPHLRKKGSDSLRFIDVWDDRIRRIWVSLRDPEAYELLRLTDRVAYLELLEEFPIREAIQDLLELANRHSTTSELCLLLRDARPAFTDDGTWIRGSSVAFLVLNLLGERLMEEATDDREPPEAFRSILTEILSTLAARPDRVPLSYSWYQHLLLTSESGRKRRKLRDHADVNPGAAMLSVAANLAGWLPPHPTPLQWIVDEQDVWRNSRICALLGIEIGRVTPDRSAIAKLLERILSDDLASSFGTGQALNNLRSAERLVMTNAVAMIPETADWFTELWDRLFWHRDRSRGHRRPEHSAPNTGQVIAIWGMFALEAMEPGSPEARALWVAVERAVRESTLTDFFRQHNDAWSQALRFLGGMWSRNFPDDPPRGAPGALDDFIELWIRPTADLALLAVILRRYGVSPGRLFRAGVSGRLLRVIVEDSTVMGRAIFHETEAAAIIALAEELEGVALA
jgi:hypothetical protein